MTKNDWIKLINAIRLRKQEYCGQDGDINYHFYYRKKSYNRNYVEDSDGIGLGYEECILEVRGGGISFSLTCVYDHKISPYRKKQEIYCLEKIQKYHSLESFTPHLCPDHPTTGKGAFYPCPSKDNDFMYHAGLYIAAFLYAFDVKDPYLQLIDREWIVVDSKLGYFDFATYFSHHQVIPIKLPIPKFIDPQQLPILKLADGVEITDPVSESPDIMSAEDVSLYLDKIRKTINQDPIL